MMYLVTAFIGGGDLVRAYRLFQNYNISLYTRYWLKIQKKSNLSY